MKIDLENIFLNLMIRYSDTTDYNVQCWNEIQKNYTSKSRYYHNLDHLKTMIGEYSEVKPQINKPDAVLFAIFYHDIIYKPGYPNNEHESALFFQKRISTTRFLHTTDVMSQIEATKAHLESDDFDTNILLDLDLVILGTSREVYLEYSKNIRKEYKIYPDLVYQKGRKKVLKHFLELETIFKTPYFVAKYEARARENLVYELTL